MNRKTRAIFLVKRLYKKKEYFEKIIFENKSFDLNKGCISFEIYPTEEEKQNNISIIKNIELKKMKKEKNLELKFIYFKKIILIYLLI